jgi:hypothetical protein
MGYVSGDGHHFNCDNPSTRLAEFHIIFCLDNSSSMGNRDRRPIRDTPIYDKLKVNHDNRLGAVYNAVINNFKISVCFNFNSKYSK